MKMQETAAFFKGRRVLLTGDTGFKGSWLALILSLFGAEVTGYAVGAPTSPALFELAGISERIRHIDGDIRDFDRLSKVFSEAKPEVVLHLAAQPIVRTSYKEPRYTYETNVMGTVNVCECVRNTDSVKSFLNVTTDKVYKNREWCWGYRENEPLDGYDPYSSSKSCSELVTHSYTNCFLSDIAVSTARAGNVIGGGDFSADRIIPDCVRAVQSGQALILRNPASVRPFQHVLEPLFLYLGICAEQYADKTKAGAYNIGPSDADCITTEELVSLFSEHCGGRLTYEIRQEKNAPHEASLLKLDTSLVRSVFGWKPVWGIRDAVRVTAEWVNRWLGGEPAGDIMADQIREYMSGEIK